MDEGKVTVADGKRMWKLKEKRVICISSLRHDQLRHHGTRCRSSHCATNGMTELVEQLIDDEGEQ